MNAIHAKLARIAGQIGPLNKDEYNREQGFHFRSVEAITAAARPLIAAEGISVAPKVLSVEHSEVTAKSGARGFRTIAHMAYTFTAAEDDSTLEVSMVGEAVDYGDKSTLKAVQMAYKYALTQVLMVGSGDDPDSHSPDVGQADRPKRPRGKPQAQAKPPSEPRTAAADDVGDQVKALKNWLLKELGDVDKAKTIWRDTLTNYGLGLSDVPSADMLPDIENDLQVAVKESESLQAEQPGAE